MVVLHVRNKSLRACPPSTSPTSNAAVTASHWRTSPLPCMHKLVLARQGKLHKLLKPHVALLISASKPTFVLDQFCLRQFDDSQYAGTRLDYDKASFVAKVNSMFVSGECPLVDGYAPFCKHVFIPNFTSARGNTLEITPQNEALLRSGYEARTDQELPVLGRWFPADTAPQPLVAAFLDVILYSREQIRKEAAAMPMGQREDAEEAPWGIISVKAQDVAYELPMQPITVRGGGPGGRMFTRPAL